MKINILFKRINKLNYAINPDILKEPIDENSEKTTTKSDFSYISALEDDRILVTVNTSVESKQGDKEFRRLDLELDVLLEVSGFSVDDTEGEIIDQVHQQYELLNKLITENITSSMTSLDDLPKL
jgi:hypothetical protein